MIIYVENLKQLKQTNQPGTNKQLLQVADSRLINIRQLFSYILTMSKWNLNYKTIPFTFLSCQNEILRDNSNEVCVRSIGGKPENSDD